MVRVLVYRRAMRRSLIFIAMAVSCTSAPAPVTPTPAPSESDQALRRERVNQLYDQQDYEGAIAAAEAILAETPDDVRMLRVATSAHCILGNAERARAHWERLPSHDQDQMSRRCARFGISFPD
jgi:hypothetical protein